jgi:hypothetical protein
MMGVFDLFSWLFGAKREGERKLRQRERSFKQRASERKKEAGSLRKEEQVLKRLERWESHELKDEKKAAKIVKRLVRYIMEARNLLRELQEEHVYHHLSREGRFVAVRSLFDRFASSGAPLKYYSCGAYHRACCGYGEGSSP